MCTTVIVGKKASVTGRVLLGHNEDAGGRGLHQQFYVPHATHGAGEVVRAEVNRAAVPQVEETLACYWSNMIVPGGSSFDQGYANEAGLVVTSNSGGTSYSGDLTDAETGLKDGGIGTLLRRLVAERARTAREAVKVAAALLDEWGYFGAARNYTFADKDEAWVMNVVKGHDYVAKRVKDDEVVLISNMLSIRLVDFDDKENTVTSPGLKEKALASGRWDGVSPFDFAMIFQSDENRHAPTKSHRMRLGWEAITGERYTDEMHYPESLKPREPMSVKDVERVLRITNPTTYAERGDGREDAFHISAVDIVRMHTRESWVVEFAQTPVMNTLWRAAACPDTSAYVPWFPLSGRTPQRCHWMPLTQARERAFDPAPEALNLDFDRNYWVYAVLAELVNFNRGLFAGVHGVRNGLEAEFERAVDDVREEARALSGEALTKCLADFTRDAVERAYKAYRELLEEIDFVKATGPSELPADPEAEVEIRVAINAKRVDAESLLWSFGFTTAKASVYEPARAKSVTIGGGYVSAVFRAGDVAPHGPKGVLCDTYVRGLADAKRFVAMVPMRVA